MACCCKSCKDKSSASCLGRCGLPKHRCLEKEEVKPGPVPRHMGWLYCAKDSPEFQLRCGWRPGHISCPVLRKIEAHNGSREVCSICPSRCSSRPSCTGMCSRICSRPCIRPPSVCSGTPSCPPGTPLIRIIRHRGRYKICTKPSNLDNSPSGPYPLKYVLDTDDQGEDSKDVKYSVEAKFNDYQFDYTSSQSSFIVDFSPPVGVCSKPCPKKSIICMHGHCDNFWPPAGPVRNKSNTDLAIAKNPSITSETSKNGDKKE